MPDNSRRLFLKNGLMSLAAVPLSRHLRWTTQGNEQRAKRKALSFLRFALSPSPFADKVTVTLEGRAENLRNETVSFGLPLPYGFLNDARTVRILDEHGTELVAAVCSPGPWGKGGGEGSIRSLLIQFKADFSTQRTHRVTVTFKGRQGRRESNFIPVSQTLIDESGLKGPRVLAVLPADWLCASGVVGPQVPATQSGAYSSSDRFVEKNFPRSLAFLDSQIYHEWLFDRTTCYYKMYVRTAEPKYLEAAYHAANFVREHTKSDGPDAGIFTLKGPDLKYVYPRAMHIHYLLTGDDRAL